MDADPHQVEFALAAAKNVHARIDAGGLGGKIVLLPWLASQVPV
jgi:hypothetical protein